MQKNLRMRIRIPARIVTFTILRSKRCLRKTTATRMHIPPSAFAKIREVERDAELQRKIIVMIKSMMLEIITGVAKDVREEERAGRKLEDALRNSKENKDYAHNSQSVNSGYGNSKC
ncbi:hypothetical protein QVD17_11137 [Tagetes erecta]|uniref:Uncharacterized protein n=1 Tax=Tagetes erecta TaxID=13708 RepID=A0AAD8L447_TARER|nr:hypothetical protein QVD17_11137 [Tagetes erecta]